MIHRIHFSKNSRLQNAQLHVCHGNVMCGYVTIGRGQDSDITIFIQFGQEKKNFFLNQCVKVTLLRIGQSWRKS